MRKWIQALPALVAAGAACAVAAPAADAYIYWGGDNYHVGVGRAELDGSDPKVDFIPAPAGTYAYINGVASDGVHVYFGVQGAGTDPAHSFVAPAIWRANVDGTAVTPFAGGGGQRVTSVGVTATHVYSTAISQDTSSVFRNPIAGGQQFSAIESTFGETNPRTCGVAADDTYVYFANMGTWSIGRAELATMGTPAQVVDPEWIKLAIGQQPCGVAVDDDTIYWGTFREPKTNVNDYDGPIGRGVYRADKATGGGARLISGDGAEVTGVAALGDFVYFSNHPDYLKTGSVKRVPKKGGTTDTLVSGLEATWGVGVDDGGVKPAPPESPNFPTPYQTPIDPLSVGCTGCTGVGSSSAPPNPVVRPDFSRVWYSKKVFRAAGWNTPLLGTAAWTSATGARARAARAAATPRATSGPGGTVFNYALGNDATMKIALFSVAPGKLKAKVCKKPTRKLKKAKSCELLKLVNTLTRRSRAGTNSVAFSGRINDKAFKPGKYRAVFTPNVGTLADAPKSIDFTIAK